jgi:hypothetical protein
MSVDPTAAAPIPIPNRTEKNAIRSSRRNRGVGDKKAELRVHITVRMHSFLQAATNRRTPRNCDLCSYNLRALAIGNGPPVAR